MLNLIENLPRASHYVQAISLDREVAAASLEMGDTPPEERFMEMSEFSTQIELLMGLHSMTASVFQAVVASTGNKPPRVRPINGPKTAYQDLKRERRTAAHRKLVSRVIPQKTKP